MITVKPFRGIQYSNAAKNASQWICPPYDMISDDARTLFQSNSAHNAVFLEAPQSYESAAKLLDQWLQNGILVQSQSPAFYLYQASYQIKNRLYHVRGVIGALRLPEHSQHFVRTHENTLEPAKKDRLELMLSTQCNFSPVFSLYRDTKQILPPILSKITEHPPTAQGEQHHISHSIWSISEPDVIQTISDFFADKTFYIADGHHRYATACNYRDRLRETQAISEDHPANYVMTLFVDMTCPGLTILPIHRTLSDIPMFNSEEILQKATAYFEVSPCKSLEHARRCLLECKAAGQNSFAFYADDAYHICKLKDRQALRQICPQSSAYQSLDVTSLHKLFLDQIVHADKCNICYLSSASRACQSVDTGNACCAILLNAPRISEVIAVADQKENMPQKSTYFYPKPITGMVFRSLKEF